MIRIRQRQETSRYRILSTLYILFRLLDSVILVVLVVNLLLTGDQETLNEILHEHESIFIVLAAEGFYDVMEYTARLWILNGFCCQQYNDKLDDKNEKFCNQL